MGPIMHKKVQNFDFWPIFLILSTWMWWIWWILMRWDEMGLYEFIWDEFTWDEFKRLIKLTSQVVANLVRSLVRSLPIKASYSSHQRWAHSWDCPCVCLVNYEISVTALRILLIFGQKLDFEILRILTKPFFRKKFLNDPKRPKTVFLTIPLIFW